MRITKRLATNPMGRPALPQVSQKDVFPAPTGGWNARDPLATMAPNDAIVLDNYIPTTGDAELRGGSAPFVTGMTGPVETLVEYSGVSVNELWAFADHKLYDVTSTGVAPAPTLSGFTNNRWQYVMQTTVGGQFLIAVNGADDLLLYDGTTWKQITAISTPAITGIATTSLFNCWLHEERIFFLANNSMSAWYLALNSISGAATELPLGSLFKKGGHLISGGNWTRDGGDGMDDLTVFITNHGEVAIFQGSDPSDATNWSLIGVYTIGAPIGVRSVIKTGADLAIICLDGIQGLSNIISIDRADSNRVALSDKIRQAFNDSASLYKNNFGWEAISYPLGNQVWFNIPIAENAMQYQYILNTTTSAWCRFIGLNANTFCLHNEQLYFGDNSGNVWVADTGDSDNNTAISGLWKSAFIYHGQNALEKQYHMVQPLLSSDISLAFGVNVVVDLDDSISVPSISSGVASGMSVWNTATWNVDPWASLVPLKQWRGVAAVGTCASLIFATNTFGYSVKINGCNILYETGGPL